MIAVFSELGQRSVLKDDAVFTVFKFVDPLDGRKFVIPCLAFNICECGLALFDQFIFDLIRDLIAEVVHYVVTHRFEDVLPLFV